MAPRVPVDGYMLYIDGALVFSDLRPCSVWIDSNMVNESSGDTPVWTYSGDGTFLGLATYVDATTPTYALGDTIVLSQGPNHLFSVVQSTPPTPTITDLTNTTWLINSTPGDSGTGSSEYYNITFTSNSTSFVAMVVSGQTGVTYGYDTPVPGEYGYVPIDLSWETYGWGYWDDMEGSFTSIPELRTITITGGTDVTNSDLISWLQSNATQIGPIPSIIQNLFIGQPKMIDGYLGDARISQIYYGNILVWERDDGPTPVIDNALLTSEGNYIVDSSGGYLITTTASYSGTITSVSKGPSPTRETYIKFGSAPTSASDYDASTSDMAVSTYSNETKVYVWGTNSGITPYDIEGGNNYSSAVEVALTHNGAIQLWISATSGGGGN